MYTCHVHEKMDKIYVHCENSVIQKLADELRCYYDSSAVSYQNTQCHGIFKTVLIHFNLQVMSFPNVHVIINVSHNTVSPAESILTKM